MKTLSEVDAQIAAWTNQGVSKPDIVRMTAE